MSKIFNYYSKDIDKCWYNSSNIKYSECIDKDGELKTVKIVFANGTQYQYNKVNVQDYLLFRENTSQGKALNKFIKSKGYEYEKLENADIDKINEEFSFRTGNGIEIEKCDDNSIKVFDNEDKLLCELKINETNYEDGIKKVLECIGYQVRKKY